ELSSAERQLVTVARALSWDAQVVIFDEPTAELAETETAQLFEVVSSLREHNIAIVYITHRLAEVDVVADDVTVMRNGEVVRPSRRGELSRSELVRSMVGKPVEQIFTPRSPKVWNAPPVLSIEGMTELGGAFRDISFTVRPGEMLGIVGLSDSG